LVRHAHRASSVEQPGVEVLIADVPTYKGKDRRNVLIRRIREEIVEENRKDILGRLRKGRQERRRRLTERFESFR